MHAQFCTIITEFFEHRVMAACMLYSIVVLTLTSSFCTADQVLNIHNAKQFERKLSPLLHSIFFETEINFGSEGGLYAEQIFNRDFEALGRGTMPHTNFNPPIEGFTFLFNDCCRGGPATTWKSQGALSASACAAACETDPLCNAVELDGCLINPETCGSECFHFFGTAPGPIVPGSCETDGDQKCYAKNKNHTRNSTSNNDTTTTTTSFGGLELDPHEPAAIATSFAPWLTVGTATANTDNSTQPFASNPTTLRLTSKAKGDGVRNPGFWGINTRPGDNFTVSFYVKSQGIDSVTASIVNPITSDTISSVTIDITTAHGVWKQFSAVVLIPTIAAPTPEAVFEVVAEQAGTINLDAVSLIPGDAVRGLWRRDVFEMVAGLKPGFIRMPGGNYLEGTGPRTRWNWKNTLGPREARAGHYNSAWGYWVTDAVGIHELLLLCEHTESEPQVSVYTGYSMEQSYVPLNQSQQFAQDALDMIEYATGDGTTPYGAKRARAGHPTPFVLTRLEVGNEERLMAPDDYPGHYKLITQAIWAKHPNMTVIASGRWGPDITGSPCLTGQRCDAWDDHYYRTPDVMAGMGHEYDDYNRSLPDVFVGEFAANVGLHMTLQAAIAEAVFMLGFEANGDKVRAATFAPMLCNVNGTQWGYDLITFDSHRLYALPSYYMQVMFREAAGDYVLQSSLSGASGVTIATASLRGTNALVIKCASYTNTTTNLQINFNGFSSFNKTATLVLLVSTAGKDATNTLDQPTFVTPVTSTIEVGKTGFYIDVPAWSVIVITLSQL